MTLPSTGTISFEDVNVELGRSPSAPISLGETEVRALAGKLTGAVSLGDLRGKGITHKLTVGSLNGGTRFGFWTSASGGSVSPNTVEYGKTLTAIMTYPATDSVNKDFITIGIGGVGTGTAGTLTLKWGGLTITENVFNGDAIFDLPQLAEHIRNSVGKTIGLNLTFVLNQ
jgi:hypothetical protein